jgi:hypothetical protein
MSCVEARSSLFCCRCLYRCDKGKKDNNVYRKENETLSECVTRLLQKCLGKIQPSFRTVVIDEAHFLKNLLTYWGLGAALLGIHAERVVPLTGTPYNNGPQDVATLMTFIDPSEDSASEKWWKNATKVGAAAAVKEAVSEWSNTYMLRREKDVLGSKLPKKTVQTKPVAPYPLELEVYEHYEATLFKVLDKFAKLVDKRYVDAKAKKKLFEQLLAMVACMVRFDQLRGDAFSLVSHFFVPTFSECL